MLFRFTGLGHEPKWVLSATAIEVKGNLTEPATDEVLVAAIADGDAVALRRLYDLHAPWVLLRLQRRCSDRGLVDEVMQESFLAVWQGARRYRGEGDVAAWIWGIAIRRLIGQLRKRVPEPSPVMPESSVIASAEEEVLLGIEHGDLGGALNRLSPELREVIRATAIDGLTNREAARLLGLPVGTVKTRLMRARAQMREGLA